MRGENLYFESSPVYQRDKALKALEIAKQLEAEQLKAGKIYQKVNPKTSALK